MSRDKQGDVLARLLRVLSFVLLAQISFLIAWNTLVKNSASNPGAQLLHLMYDFSSPAELAADQAKLKEMVHPEIYEAISVDNPLRMVNAYYKFGYSAAHVQPIEAVPGAVLYRIVNDNVPYEQLWLLVYEVAEDGRVSYVREYRLSHVGGN